MAGTETNQQTGFDLNAKNQALFINESLKHLAHVIKMLTSNVNPKNIPFHHDPLTLVIKNALVGERAKTRMFVNISPSKFDTAVTNRSLKFSQQTGMIRTKAVDHAAASVTFEREKRFEKNNLKLLKCSPADEAVNYKVVYPDT